MVRQCESAHCSGADAEINEICKLEGWPINHPVLTRDAIGPCYCSCSCLAFGTMVEDGMGGFKAIEMYAVGDQIMASGTGLTWAARPVVFSGGTTGASRQKYTVLVRYAETALAVTSDHLFLLAGDEHTLKRADRLAPEDVLISPSGDPVSVTAVHIGDYLAGFHHVAASDKEAPGEDLEGHLLNTNGVVSADYVVQIMARRSDVAGFNVKQHENMPVVGSAEYVDRYGRACLQAPELPESVTANTPLRTSGFNAPDLDLAEHTFVPAEATMVNVPDGACSFLSPEEAEVKRRSPKRPFNDPLAREWTEALIQQHKTFYPDVTYHLDWASDEVNAYAWVENGVRHVALKGGLVRDQDLELEGIALVLAHELAHHYGGTPTFPGGLSCEGQADYRGVRNIMRKVWFGDSYIATTDAGIAQMANFFGVPNDPHAPGGTAGCGHPPGACRVATYHSAVSLAGKPACAA
ncbi:hypothetical protein [Streptomyces iconiensis]|uniref:Hint domain-containing protein n=1 Tax=Streptomyces iconiensis TaxID=1384038 RepID=A0ABT7A1R1_9ACTN|nr:hypothetical protein [Streptomyces iconiensis]MDJ1135012.1 hypothetical protein [Streptomyces iconiensis]